jgi:NAD(P)-dependent dehydrogenase (short-subunit alcohol dehydrogenase family)
MQSLNNQRVLVVGGTSGIGFATAVAAIGAGAIVTIASRNQKNLDTAAANLGSGVQMRALDPAITISLSASSNKSKLGIIL